MKSTITAPVMMPVKQLHPFKGHPYKVRDDDEMNALIESIQLLGILSPLTVRPIENTKTEYEVVSGHRRLRAAQKAGMKEVPVEILPIDRDTAAIIVADSNLYREHILPSEKAFAYKIKMDAMSHRGITYGQNGHKSRDVVSDTHSGRTVQRYIRLTDLIPDLLEYVDDGRMAMSIGVELSYLDEDFQYNVIVAMEQEDCTPSYSQALQLKNMYRKNELSEENIFNLLRTEKPNQTIAYREAESKRKDKL